MHQNLRHAAIFVVALALAPSLEAQQAAVMDHSAHGQPAASPKLDSELVEHFKGIELSDAQVKQVLAIKAKHHKAMDALKKDAKDHDDPALTSALQKHMDAEHAEFKALLTADQARLFDENMKGHHKAEGAKHEAKPGQAHEMKAGEKHEMKPGEKHEMKHEAPRKP